MLALDLQYALFVFWAAIGTVQIAAAYAGLKGLLLVRSRAWAIVTGAVVLLVAFSWFFGLVDRNVRGLEGAEQALLFLPTAVAAVVITGVAASLIHGTREPDEMFRKSTPRSRTHSAPRGLEALRSVSFLDAWFDEKQGPLA
jgi:hypothetical protein